jgi:hypothetical protein
MTTENTEQVKLEFRNEVAKVLSTGGGNHDLQQIFGKRGLDEETMKEIVFDVWSNRSGGTL